MQTFVVIAALVACASANPQFLVNNLGLYGGSAITYGIPTQQIVSQQIVAPVATKTQYHAQDELGQASYGYAHAGQAHAAVRDAAGNVRGSYAYVNPEGKEVRVEYVADQGGFRVASNALPVGPVAGVQALPQLVQAPVRDTPEVIQARAAHLQAHAEALARSGRKKRGVVSVIPSALGYSSVVGHPINTVAVNQIGAHQIVGSPYLASGYASQYVTAYNTPAIVQAPVQHVRAATLTKTVLTPSHAVSYRVD